jgi:hypothetical protein
VEIIWPDEMKPEASARLEAPRTVTLGGTLPETAPGGSLSRYGTHVMPVEGTWTSVPGGPLTAWSSLMSVHYPVTTEFSALLGSSRHGFQYRVGIVRCRAMGEHMIEVSKEGRTIYFRIGVWLEKDDSIHLSASDVDGFHVAVNKDPEKPNGHPTLFKRLAKCLRDNGAPAPPED